MCGICGELRFDGRPANTLAVARMSDKIVRRGPDHSGAFSDGPLALGHRRLAIIDLSAEGDQPTVDEEQPALRKGRHYGLVTLRLPEVMRKARHVTQKALAGTVWQCLRGTFLRRWPEGGRHRSGRRLPVARRPCDRSVELAPVRRLPVARPAGPVLMLRGFHTA